MGNTSDVQFEEHENEYAPTRMREEPKPQVDITGMLVKKGVVKDHSTAEMLLAGVAVFLFALAAYNFFSHWNRSTTADDAAQLHPENQVVQTVPGSQ